MMKYNPDTYCKDCKRSIYGEYANCDANIENLGRYVGGDQPCNCKIVKTCEYTPNETMEDETMTLEDFIKELEIAIKQDGHDIYLKADSAKMIKDVLVAKNSFVQPEQQWIPCSERLPKPYEYCLWTTIDGRVVYHHCDGLFSKYIAWMPLPEPFTERREEQ